MNHSEPLRTTQNHSEPLRTTQISQILVGWPKLLLLICSISFCNSRLVAQTEEGDSSEVYTIIQDTIFTNMYGLDSVFTIITDTIPDTIGGWRLAETRNYYGSNNYQFRDPLMPSETAISLGNITKPINYGLFGVHIGGLFFPDILPTYDQNPSNALNWLSDLCPASLRFPSGGSTKFMHLLPYRDVDGVGGLDPIKGYGYDLAEIIRYYDVTDNTIEADDPTFYASIIYDLEHDGVDEGTQPGDCDNWALWIENISFKEDFEGYYSKWVKQQAITSDKPSAIEQFVSALKDIKVKYPNHTVDVIICLNIFSSSATQCREIVSYLRGTDIDNNPDPTVHTFVNVVGVEIGNENYFASSREMLGMETFQYYWNFINGGNSAPYWWSNFSAYVFSPEMLSDHNYISAFKLYPETACKIGIPATNIPEDGYALRESETITDPPLPGALTWNQNLHNKYGANIPGTHIKCFDAVVLHPYYVAKENYQDIAMLFDDTYGCPLFNFGTYDTRMQPAFDGILGVTDPPLFGNFRDFILSRYRQSYDYHNEMLGFKPVTPSKKELWTTEWNSLGEFTDYETEENEDARVSIYNNTFTSAFLLQEWILQNLRLNYTKDFYPNFFTYANFHNFSGTDNNNNLVLNADCSDLKQHNITPTDPNDFVFLRRTNYYTMLHLSEIVKNKLIYLRSNAYQYPTDKNIAPVFFIDEDYTEVTGYYSNIDGSDRHFIIDATDLLGFFPYDPELGAPIHIDFSSPTVNCIDALQPYSGSGSNTQFELNTCYACSESFWHPFEIRAENTAAVRSFTADADCISALNPDEICITVPGYSVGYFNFEVTPIYPSVKLTQSTLPVKPKLTVYPNPAVDRLFLIVENLPEQNTSPITMHIIDVTGKTIILVDGLQQQIDISSLSQGIYTLYIESFNGERLFAKFIKS